MLKEIFCPNGIGSLTIINKLAQKEFGEQIKQCNSYGKMKYEIIQVLGKLSPKELEENKLDTLVGIKHLEENDFSNFVSVRFAYWGMMIAIAALLVENMPIYEYFNMTKNTFGNCIIIGLTVLLVTMSRTIHIQHDQKEYLNFKMICFDEIEKSRRNNSKR